MQCEFPTVNANKEEIKEIFENTKTIAIVGCSPDESKPSCKVTKYLLDAGFKVVPIYPKHSEILGQKVYRALEDIPFKVDLVDVFRKPEVVSKIVQSAIKRGDIYCIWTQLGIVNNEASQKAIDAGIKVVQNFCTKIEHQRLS